MKARILETLTLASVAGLALYLAGCAGTIPQAMPDRGAVCDTVYAQDWDRGRIEYVTAVFPVVPGVTQVTVCIDAMQSTAGRETCRRMVARYYEGTAIGFVACGSRDFGSDGALIQESVSNVRSITVHNGPACECTTDMDCQTRCGGSY